MLAPDTIQIGFTVSSANNQIRIITTIYIYFNYLTEKG